ncbi:MAG: hypothetical protein FWE74_10550, partial [Oscillospiraceae bacterium]|nr:hypothetical protein [Oscillospiraceae bacterium]
MKKQTNNEIKSRIFANKINKLGAVCDIIHDSNNIAQYTHVFFDSSKLYEISKAHCPGTKLIAVVRGFIDNEKITPNIELIQTPFTSILASRLLGS